MPLETRPVPSAGPQAIVGTSAVPPLVTSAEKMTSYGFSGENENSFFADRPLASRYSSVSVARGGRGVERIGAWLEQRLRERRHSRPRSSVISVNGFVDPAGALPRNQIQRCAVLRIVLQPPAGDHAAAGGERRADGFVLDDDLPIGRIADERLRRRPRAAAAGTAAGSLELGGGRRRRAGLRRRASRRWTRPWLRASAASAET